MENLLGLYSKYWLPFGELLTDMERRGIKVNVDYLKQIQLTAEKDKRNYEEAFLQWVYKVQPDCSEFNPNSVQQM
jgi:DNA polymerase-1